MQIREITEGIAGTIGKAIANRFTQSQIGVNAFDKARAAASITPRAPLPPQKIGALVTTAEPVDQQPAVPATAAEPDSGIIVTPGRRIRVVDPVSKGVYYKTDKGWFNELNQPVSAGGIARLEKLADQGLGREENIPKAPVKNIPPKQQRKRR